MFVNQPESSEKFAGALKALAKFTEDVYWMVVKSNEQKKDVCFMVGKLQREIIERCVAPKPQRRIYLCKFYNFS